MKKYWSLSILLGLIILTSISINNYLDARVNYYQFIDQIQIASMYAILFIDLLFFTLLFLIDFKIYKLVLKFILILAINLWGFVHFQNYFKDRIIPLPTSFWLFWDVLIMITYAFLASGIVLYAIHHIRHSTEKYEDNKLFGAYHVHEGFFGVILTIGGILLWILREMLQEIEIFKKDLEIVIAFMGYVLFGFLYVGGFLIFRDWHDVMHLKFLEKKDSREKNNETSIFSRIFQEDVHFFEMPKVSIYPIGIVLTLFSISALVYRNNFLPETIFYLNGNIILIIGYILSFIAGALIGKDWLRVFRRYYLDEYQEIKARLDFLREEIKKAKIEG